MLSDAGFDKALFTVLLIQRFQDVGVGSVVQLHDNAGRVFALPGIVCRVLFLGFY